MRRPRSREITSWFRPRASTNRWRCGSAGIRKPNPTCRTARACRPRRSARTPGSPSGFGESRGRCVEPSTTGRFAGHPVCTATRLYSVAQGGGAAPWEITVKYNAVGVESEHACVRTGVDPTCPCRTGDHWGCAQPTTTTCHRPIWWELHYMGLSGREEWRTAVVGLAGGLSE